MTFCSIPRAKCKVASRLATFPPFDQSELTVWGDPREVSTPAWQWVSAPVLPEASHRQEHAERYQEAPCFEPCWPNQSTCTFSQGAAMGADSEITPSQGKRSQLCLFPSRKLKGSHGELQRFPPRLKSSGLKSEKTRGRGSPQRQFSTEFNQQGC